MVIILLVICKGQDKKRNSYTDDVLDVEELKKNQGRTASYLTAPSQIPACGITAPCSSNLLIWALTSVMLSGIPRSVVYMVNPAFLIRDIFQYLLT